MLILILGGPRKVVRVLSCDLQGVGAVDSGSVLGCPFLKQLGGSREVPQPRQLVLVPLKQNLRQHPGTGRERPQDSPCGHPCSFSQCCLPCLSGAITNPVSLFP